MHELAIETANPLATFNIIGTENSTISHANITDSLDQMICDKIKQKKRFFAIEVSPVPGPEDLNFKRFKNTQPMFTSITWLLDHNIKINPISQAPALRLAKIIRKFNPVLSHLTCYKMTEDKLHEIMQNDIKNVLALKGDRESDNQTWKHAIDLVKAIRKIMVNATIAVAGYPEVHAEATSCADDLRFLKEKVDVGANFILTNVCFSFEKLVDFIKSCRSLGITVPIIPGIYIPTSYSALITMCRICKITVPDEQMANYSLYKDDAYRFSSYAMTNANIFLDQIFDFEEIFGVHFFTLNKYEHIYEIVEKYNFEN